MVRKLCFILGIAMVISSAPIASMSQTDSTEHHTGVKRTYHKVKHTVKKTWKAAKSGVKMGADSTKANLRKAKPDDESH